MSIHQISNKKLTLLIVEEIIKSNKKLELSTESREKVQKCRTYLDNKMAAGEEVIYGINTGFGSLCNTVVTNEELGELQHNLVKSHACGLGEEIPQEIVQIMMLLKVQGLSYGHSGISMETLSLLIELYNNQVFPVVYSQGSLGASGDLAPLAHISLTLIGLGEVNYKNQKRNSIDVLNELGLKPVQLQSKEGLALLNGTQFMQAFGVYMLTYANKYKSVSDMIACVSIEGYNGHKSPFNPLIHQVRNQKGQEATAKNVLNFLEGSEIFHGEKMDVQDPYSFRCIPQVHGASKDMIDYVTRIFETEINSVTDNPTIFPDEDLIISAGNFHGQPLAITLDSLALALAEIASISERRIYKLIAGNRNLPAFLVKKPGLNSGFMIPQYTAASIVSQNKQLCTPAVVDTIDSSNGQEDHVSMGANAATKCFKVFQNMESVLGIELLAGFQAMDFRQNKKSSKAIEELRKDYRTNIQFIENDVEMHIEMNKSIQFIKRLVR
ncbi:MAG: histidine ammonia-lyase [Flavobacteriales bacterium]